MNANIMEKKHNNNNNNNNRSTLDGCNSREMLPLTSFVLKDSRLQAIEKLGFRFPLHVEPSDTDPGWPLHPAVQPGDRETGFPGPAGPFTHFQDLWIHPDLERTVQKTPSDLLRENIQIVLFQFTLLETEADQADIPTDLWRGQAHRAVMCLRGEDPLDSIRVFLAAEFLWRDLSGSLEQGGCPV